MLQALPALTLARQPKKLLLKSEFHPCLSVAAFLFFLRASMVNLPLHCQFTRSLLSRHFPAVAGNSRLFQRRPAAQEPSHSLHADQLVLPRGRLVGLIDLVLVLPELHLQLGGSRLELVGQPFLE